MAGRSSQVEPGILERGWIKMGGHTFGKRWQGAVVYIKIASIIDHGSRQPVWGDQVMSWHQEITVSSILRNVQKCWTLLAQFTAVHRSKSLGSPWWTWEPGYKGLFTYYVSQKWGGPDPPSPPCQPKIRNWLTPPRPFVRKNQKLAKPPPPLSETIFWRTPISLVKRIFQEEIYSFKIN